MLSSSFFLIITNTATIFHYSQKTFDIWLKIFYYYKNDNLQESYSAVHEEICTNLSGLIDPETNTVQILGLVQLSNSFNFQANQDKYDRRDSLESEKKEVEEFLQNEMSEENFEKFSTMYKNA